MLLRIKLAAWAMAAGAAVPVLAGAPAMASSRPVTGPEIASGVLAGKAATSSVPAFALTWRGLVNTHSVFRPRGSGPQQGRRYTFTTSAGKLAVVVTARPAGRQSPDLKACRFAVTTYVVFAVVGGKSTRRFAGTSGPGVLLLSFAGYSPRYTAGRKKGQCNTSPGAAELAQGAVASFDLSVVLKT